VWIDLKEIHEPVQEDGVLGVGPGGVDLLFLQEDVSGLVQRIAVDYVRQGDLFSFLADALEGDGGLAAVVQHAKADAPIADE